MRLAKRFLSFILASAIGATTTIAQSPDANTVEFDKVKIVVPVGKKFTQKSVTLVFTSDELKISGKTPAANKVFAYSDIVASEYSYSKSPRWKTGLGLGAASILLPPLILIAIPLGFTKHRRHWLTIRTKDDFAVLKLSKKNRKLIIPTLETRTGSAVNAAGEDK